jgi:thiamine transport system permease protein
VVIDPILPRRTATIAFVVSALWLGVFFVVPVGSMLIGFVGVDDTLRVLDKASTWRIVWFSTWQATLSVLATFAIAVPVTWLIGRHEFPGRRALRAITTVGFLLPSVVVGAAFLAVLPREWHYTAWAVILAHAYFNVAVVVRVVGARLELLDSRLGAAARTLGATPTQAVRTVVFPFVRGAVVSASAVIFVYCFSSFAVVRLLGGPSRNTMESDIALRAFGIGDLPGAVVMSVLQATTILSVVMTVRGIASGEPVTIRSAPVALARLEGRLRWWAPTISIVTTAFVIVPLVAVAVRSVRFGDGTSFEAWRSISQHALWLSVVSSTRTAIAAGVVGTLLALTTAFAVVRLGVRGRLLDVATIVPLAVSPVTLGLGIVVTFDTGWFDWRGKWWFVAVAHTLVAFPLAVRVLVPVWRTVPRGLHATAAVLGADETQRLLHIDLRLLRRAIVAALGIIVAVSLGEFGAASLLSRDGAETLPVAIARLFARTGDLVRAQGFALATILIVACVAVLAVVESVLGRRHHVAGR